MIKSPYCGKEDAKCSCGVTTSWTKRDSNEKIQGYSNCLKRYVKDFNLDKLTQAGGREGCVGIKKPAAVAVGAVKPPAAPSRTRQAWDSLIARFTPGPSPTGSGAR